MADLSIYGGLFLSALLAATVLPVSSEAVLAGLLATGTGNPLMLFLVATVGNTLGSVVNWLLGRGIARWRDRPWFPVTRGATRRRAGSSRALASGRCCSPGSLWWGTR